jgi:hypothetical protein
MSSRQLWLFNWVRFTSDEDIISLNQFCSKKTLTKLQKRLKIPSVRNPPSIEVSRQAVIDAVSSDTLQLNGPAFFQVQLRRRGLMIPRFVHQLLASA